MSIERMNENVCFSCNASPMPVLLFAGHRYQKGDQTRINRIPSHYLFHFISSGSGRVFLQDDRELSVSTGDWFTCFPDQSISYEQNPKDPWNYYWLAFQGRQSEAILSQAGITRNSGIVNSADKERSENLCQAMHQALNIGSIKANLEANSYLFQLLHHFIDSAPCAAVEDNKSGHSSVLHTHVESACSFMVNNFENGLRAEDVAEYVGFERTYFAKVFSQIAGTTIREFLAKLRIQRSEELLTQKTHTIAFIANAIGYNDSRTFSRFFKQQTGLAPKEWQNLNCSQ